MIQLLEWLTSLTDAPTPLGMTSPALAVSRTPSAFQTILQVVNVVSTVLDQSTVAKALVRKVVA
jgi:hypothetical protein